MSAPTLILPPKGALGPNNKDDPYRYYYVPLVGRLFTARIDLGLRLLDGLPRPAAALELGYGSGLLLPTLCRLADSVSGVDLSSEPAEVIGRLRALGVINLPHLIKGSADDLPFQDAAFDLIVAFSLFEHLPEAVLLRTIHEAARVLRPGGHLLVGCPAVNRGMSVLFRAIGFRDIEHHHVSDIHDVLHLAGTGASPGPFVRCKQATLPAALPLGTALYSAVLLQKPTFSTLHAL